MAKLVPVPVASERALRTGTDEDDLTSRVDEVLGMWAHEKGLVLCGCLRRRAYGFLDDADPAVARVEWGRVIAAGTAQSDFTEET